MLTRDEIITLYKSAKDKQHEIEILSELTASDIDTIIQILKEEGVTIEGKFKLCRTCGMYMPDEGKAMDCRKCKERLKKERFMARYHMRKGGKQSGRA